MFAARLAVTAELKLLTPLHLGTGEVAVYDSITHPDPATGKLVPTQIATVMRDAAGLPVIPGASVKGVLRSLVDDDGDARDLFGPPSGSDRLAAGRLTARAMRYAEANEPARLAADLPYADKAMPDGVTLAARGLYVAARTAIDPATGRADEGKLFYQEMTAPGACFKLRLDLRLDPDGTAPAAETCLMRALGALVADGGVAFGRGQSLGQGRLRLLGETLGAERLAADPATGRLTGIADTSIVKRVTIGTATAAFTLYTLRLSCDGPFLIDDTNIKPDRGSEEPRRNAQRHGGNPLLPGSTLAGALRARAGWLAKLRWTDDRRCDRRDRILALDDEAAKRADPGRVVTRPDSLTPTERLFGVTGWRGLMRIAGVRCERVAGFENITSVKLDRFSMAPIDDALFTTRAAIDPIFEVAIEVEQQKRGDYPNEDDEALFELLLDDLRTEGLMLGHGTSRGYGWFEVSQVDP